MRNHIVTCIALEGPTDISEAFTATQELEPKRERDQLEVSNRMPYRQRHPAWKLVVLFPGPRWPVITKARAETINCPQPNLPPSFRADGRSTLKPVTEERPCRRWDIW